MPFVYTNISRNRDLTKIFSIQISWIDSLATITIGSNKPRGSNTWQIVDIIVLFKEFY